YPSARARYIRLFSAEIDFRGGVRARANRRVWEGGGGDGGEGGEEGGVKSAECRVQSAEGKDEGGMMNDESAGHLTPGGAIRWPSRAFACPTLHVRPWTFDQRAVRPRWTTSYAAARSRVCR